MKYLARNFPEHVFDAIVILGALGGLLFCWAHQDYSQPWTIWERFGGYAILGVLGAFVGTVFGAQWNRYCQVIWDADVEDARKTPVPEWLRKFEDSNEIDFK